MEKPLTESEFARAVDDALPQLIAVAHRLAGNEELAVEAVQNALLKASKSWRRFRGDSHVNTWLTKIVIHAVRDLIASERKRSNRCRALTPFELETQLESATDASDGPRQRVLDEECRMTIQTAVLDLPDRQREVFILMIWQHLPARQVGLLLDVDPQTVHANLYAARKRLQEVLRPYLDDDQDR